MTFPIVTELPRRLEPVTADSFIAPFVPSETPAPAPRRRIVD